MRIISQVLTAYTQFSEFLFYVGSIAFDYESFTVFLELFRNELGSKSSMEMRRDLSVQNLRMLWKKGGGDHQEESVPAALPSGVGGASVPLSSALGRNRRCHFPRATGK